MVIKEKDFSIIEKEFFDEQFNLCKGYCCATLTIGKIKRITKTTFIESMKLIYPTICKEKLSDSRIQSWKEEYDEIRMLFAGTNYYDDIYLIFEYKMPKSLLEKDGKYIYCDIIMASNNRTVTMECKGMDFKAAEAFAYEAAKYVRRMKYHKYSIKNKIINACYLYAYKDNQKIAKPAYKYLVESKIEVKIITSIYEKQVQTIKQYFYYNGERPALDNITDFLCSDFAYKNK